MIVAGHNLVHASSFLFGRQSKLFYLEQLLAQRLHAVVLGDNLHYRYLFDGVVGAVVCLFLAGVSAIVVTTPSDSLTADSIRNPVCRDPDTVYARVLVLQG
jgi:hypothetical protein